MRFLFIALAGAGVAVLLEVVSMASGHRLPRIATAIAVGLVAGIGSIVVRKKTPPRASAEAASAPRQIVGSSCCVCDARILTVLDAKTCERCTQPLHHGCVDQHDCAGGV